MRAVHDMDGRGGGGTPGPCGSAFEGRGGFFFHLFNELPLHVLVRTQPGGRGVDYEDVALFSDGEKSVSH